MTISASGGKKPKGSSKKGGRVGGTCHMSGGKRKKASTKKASTKKKSKSKSKKKK